MKRKNWLKGIVIAGILAGCFALSAAAAHVGVGTVQGEGLRLRAEPNLQGSTLTYAHKGEHVIVLEKAGDWYKVSYNAQEGYMSGGFVEVSTSAEADLGYGQVTTSGSSLNLRSGASTSTEKLASIPYHSVVELVGFQDGWYKVTYNGHTGYVSSDYITPVKDAGAADAAPASASSFGQRLVAEALKHVGKRYVYGGKGPNSFDCSGFVYYCVKQVSGGSINLTGGASTQWRTAPGQRIRSIDQMQPGDLFFINDPAYGGSNYVATHVAIYLGNGQLVHASSSTTGVITNALKDKDYRYFVGAIRLG